MSGILDKKNVFVTSANQVDNIELIANLKAHGANVLVSEHSPHTPENAAHILGELETHQKKGPVHALVVHDANVEMTNGEKLVTQLTQSVKGQMPVVAFDKAPKQYATEVRDAGAHYLNSLNGANMDRIGYEVADRIQQHGKPAGMSRASTARAE